MPEIIELFPNQEHDKKPSRAARIGLPIMSYAAGMGAGLLVLPDAIRAQMNNQSVVEKLSEHPENIVVGGLLAVSALASIIVESRISHQNHNSESEQY